MMGTKILKSHQWVWVAQFCSAQFGAWFSGPGEGAQHFENQAPLKWLKLGTQNH